MGVTRLKRKDRKNKARANNRVAKIKQLLLTPVIKNVDVEELKSRFNKGGNSENAEQPTAAPATPAAAPAPAPAAAPATVAASPALEAPAPDNTQAPVGTPSAEEVFEAEEARADKLAADEADALEPGDVESPAERFLRNQVADSTATVQEKDIEAIEDLEEDEADTTNPPV